MTDLKVRAKELSKQAADYSRQGVDLIRAGDREKGHNLMKQANEAGKRCRVLLKEIIRQQS
ncbi:MAG: hypothetical protein KME60_24135 [Cyanomargarita calcarea GSE-NOS-MK-12-04C]|jgi:hypothetical protein|uniref:Uncharacterized protein n=1 Tax=Cyanomargarita calcarea GSE-NOS-MK-12-04C TaxID=2839659 RepID=A0A951QSJ1_9CYAN|nr:hypothetical protein [Cyanomargarita calcarea GSE-NOS-MK-12-04C]